MNYFVSNEQAAGQLLWLSCCRCLVSVPRDFGWWKWKWGTAAGSISTMVAVFCTAGRCVTKTASENQFCWLLCLIGRVNSLDWESYTRICAGKILIIFACAKCEFNCDWLQSKLKIKLRHRIWFCNSSSKINRVSFLISIIHISVIVIHNLTCEPHASDLNTWNMYETNTHFCQTS